MVSFRLRMLQSFESGHDIASSKSFVLGRTTTGDAMPILAHTIGGFRTTESQVRFVSARGLSASDILVPSSGFLSFTTPFFEFGPSHPALPQVVRAKEPLFRRGLQEPSAHVIRTNA